MTEIGLRAPLYARADHLVATEMAGQTVMLNTQNWGLYEFDKVGSSILSLLDAPRTLPALVQALMETHDVDEARCTADAKAFLDDMIAQGIVAIVDA